METTDGLRMLWRARWWIALFALLAAAAVYVVSRRAERTYHATALGIVVSSTQATGGALSADQLLQLTNTYVELARTNVVLEQATADVPRDVPRSSFASSVSVTPKPQPGLIEFSADARNGRTAAIEADTYMDAFVRYLAGLQDGLRVRSLAAIQGQIQSVTSQLDTARGSQRIALSAQLQDLEAKQTDATASPGDSVKIVQRAATPSSPTSPKPTRNALLALLAALVAGVAATYLLLLVRDRYGSAEEAAGELGLPLLGRLPLRRRGKRSPRKAADAERFRAVCTRIDFSLSDRGRSRVALGNGVRTEVGQLLLVTAPERRTGKSYVSAGLARAFASEGRRVVALDGDGRPPTVDEHLERPTNSEPSPSGNREAALVPAGAATAFATETDRAAVRLRPVPEDTLDTTTVWLPADNRPPILESPRRAAAIDELRQACDLIVLDGPPVLEGADAMMLSRYADGVVLVIDARRTRRRDARRAVATLREINAPLLGVIFNAAPSSM